MLHMPRSAGRASGRLGWRLGALGLALCPALSFGPPPKGEPAQDSSATVTQVGPASSEHFLIEWQGEGPHPAAGYRGERALMDAAREGALGLAVLHRREVDGGWQLEQDVAFPFADVRLMAVECLDPKSPRLVWREVTPGGGRTIFAEWTAESERLKAVEWGMDGSLRESISTVRGAVMPQYLLELGRSGRLAAGRFEVFDPISAELETWSVELSYRRRPEPGGSVTDGVVGGAEYIRRLEFRREDGSLAGRYDFDGTTLERFQWQEGSLVARRISPAAYEDLRSRWGLEGATPAPAAGAAGVKNL
jgi:hypothetical protein